MKDDLIRPALYQAKLRAQAPGVGFEPTTSWLTAMRTTAMLPGPNRKDRNLLWSADTTQWIMDNPVVTARVSKYSDYTKTRFVLSGAFSFPFGTPKRLLPGLATALSIEFHQLMTRYALIYGLYGAGIPLSPNFEGEFAEVIHYKKD